MDPTEQQQMPTATARLLPTVEQAIPLVRPYTAPKNNKCCSTCLWFYSIFNERYLMVNLLISCLFCLSDGRIMKGYMFFLLLQVLGSMVIILLNFKILSDISSIQKYYLSGIVTGLSFGLAFSFVAFQLALGYDYMEKCTYFKPVNERSFNFAFAYNCDGAYLTLAQIFGFFPITIMRILGWIAETTKCCLHRTKGGDHFEPIANVRHSSQSMGTTFNNNGNNYVNNEQNGSRSRESFVDDIFSPGQIVAVLDIPRRHSGKVCCRGLLSFLLIVIATISTFFINDYAETKGSCPVVNVTMSPYNDEDNAGGTAITSLIFRSKPAIGVEVDHCGWRRWGSQGTCVKYPFNYTYFGQPVMGEAVADRLLTGLNFNSAGSNESVANHNACSNMLGLFSCATYSPKAGNFITLVKNGEIHMNVCPDWCYRLFHACSTTWCDTKNTAEECCNTLNPSTYYSIGAEGTWVTMAENKSKPGNGCYSAGHHNAPSMSVWLFLVINLLSVSIICK